MPGKDRQISLSEARVILDQINEVRYGGIPVRELTLDDGTPFWPFFQQSLLYEGIRGLRTPLRRPSFWRRVALATSKAGMVLVSLVAGLFLILSRRRVLIFTGDRVSSKSNRCDFRLEGIYDHLRRDKVRFFEIVHANPGKEWLRNFFRRRRLVFYLEAVEYLYAMWPRRSRVDVSRLSGEHLPEDIRARALDLVAHCLARAPIIPFKIAFLRRLLSWSRIEVLLAIDDTRYYHELLLACRANGIATHAFQHGHFTRYHVGWLKLWEEERPMVLPDQFVVWSDYWKQELGRLRSLFPADRIHVGGRPSGQAVAKTLAKPAPVEELTVVVPYETEAIKSEVTAFVRKLLAMKHIKVLFKVRPDVPAARQLEEYELQSVPRIEVVTHLPPTRRIDLVVGTYSTFLYDMVEQDVPVCLLKTALDLGEGMAENGLAERIDASTVTESELFAIARQDIATRQAKAQKLVGKTPADLGRTLRKIMSRQLDALRLLA